MDINQKTAKIPFWLLFGIASFIIIFDFIYTYLFLSNNSAAYEDSPIHAFFVNIFGLNYFLIMIPISIIILYIIIRCVDWIIKKIDKKTGINGRNYTAVIIILLTFPNVLVNEIFYILSGRNLLGWGFRESLLAGLILAIIYISIAEIEDKKYKKEH